MVYQDHRTKFVILNPLKSKRAEEVSAQLTEIYTTFGAPVILHSDNGREFVNAVIKKLHMRSGMKWKLYTASHATRKARDPWSGQIATSKTCWRPGWMKKMIQIGQRRWNLYSFRRIVHIIPVSIAPPPLCCDKVTQFQVLWCFQVFVVPATGIKRDAEMHTTSRKRYSTRFFTNRVIIRLW